jgi:hypothetical protein
LISHYNWCFQAALRRVIHECTGSPLRPLPSDIEKANYGLVKLQKVASLFDIIDNISDPLKGAVSEHPLSMEQIGQVSTNLIISVFPLLLLNISSKFTVHISVIFVRCLDFYCTCQNTKGNSHQASYQFQRLWPSSLMFLGMKEVHLF